MKNLIIIGARGFGREVYNLFLKCKNANPDWEIECKGFLDSKSDALLAYNNYPPVISSVEDYEIKPNDIFLCALGDVHYKKLYVEKILSKGGTFISLIHPDAEIDLNTKIGIGCIIRTACSISCDVEIGDFVTIMGYSVLGHDCKVKNWSHLGAYSFLGGFSEVGELCTIHPGARLLPHKKVGDNATIGVGSVILKNVKPGVTVFGNPAKILQY